MSESPDGRVRARSPGSAAAPSTRNDANVAGATPWARSPLPFLFSLALAAFLLLEGALLPRAQTVTGSLAGVVWNEEGKPIAGAEVTVSGASIQGLLKTFTDESGNYGIVQLPPSEDLTVRAVSAEAGRSDTFHIRIKAGVVTTLNLVIAPVESTEIEVFGTPISTRQATVPTTLPEVEARTVPFIGEFSDRSYQSLLYFNPTATHSRLAGNPAMGGATGVENVYLIDGLYTNDPVLGTFGVYLNSIFFREMASEIYGVEAQNPTSTGGFFNLITRSGSNEFHGDVFAWTTHSGLMARKDSDDFEVAEEQSWTAVDYGFALGGPILRDRLWFFAGVNPYTKTEENRGSDIVRRLDTGALLDFPFDHENRTRTTTYLGKLTWRAHDNHRVEFVAFGDPSSQKLNEGPSPTAYPAARDSLRDKGGASYGLRWFGAFSPRVFGEAFFGSTRMRNDLKPGPAGAAGSGVPLAWSLNYSPELAITPGFGQFTLDTRTTRQFGVKFTGLLDTRSGFHEITGGRSTTPSPGSAGPTTRAGTTRRSTTWPGRTRSTRGTTRRGSSTPSPTPSSTGRGDTPPSSCRTGGPPWRTSPSPSGSAGSRTAWKAPAETLSP